MKTIQIQNGKATYEGEEIENSEDLVLPSEAINPSPHPGLSKFINGIYPLPEGWDVVKEYYRKSNVSPEYIKVDERVYKDCCKYGEKTKQTARLIKKEPSCPDKESCLPHLKEGCPWEELELSDKTQPSAPIEEELMKEFIEKFSKPSSIGLTFNIGWKSTPDVFNWFSSKIRERDKIIDLLKKELRNSKNESINSM